MGELMAVHAGESPKGRKVGTLEEDVDGAGVFSVRDGDAEAVGGGMDDAALFQRVADEGGVRAGGDVLQIVVGAGGAVHG